MQEAFEKKKLSLDAQAAEKQAELEKALAVEKEHLARELEKLALVVKKEAEKAAQEASITAEELRKEAMEAAIAMKIADIGVESAAN